MVILRKKFMENNEYPKGRTIKRKWCRLHNLVGVKILHIDKGCGTFQASRVFIMASRSLFSLVASCCSFVVVQSTIGKFGFQSLKTTPKARPTTSWNTTKTNTLRNKVLESIKFISSVSLGYLAPRLQALRRNKCMQRFP